MLQVGTHFSEKTVGSNLRVQNTSSQFLRSTDIYITAQEVGCGYMDWIGLAQDRDRWRMLVSAVMSLRVP